MTDSGVTRCGTIVLAGEPNAGKSTLLNRLVGEPLAITSAKPQSTRYAVIGIRTEQATQTVFVDPPGLLEPNYPMQERMLDEAHRMLRQSDAVLHLHPLSERSPPALSDLLPPSVQLSTPVLELATKADLVPAERRIDGSADRLAVSAVTGEGITDLLQWCRDHTPLGPFRYDPEDLSTQPVRFFVTEFVREAAFDVLGAELPYSLAAEVDEFREGSKPLYIRLTVYLERDSQKGMVVGKRGRTIKTIGTRARARIETFLGTPVFLDIWVKTLPKWRSDPSALQRFGFSTSRSP